MKDSRSLRWWGVVTLFVIVAISYVDRINISVLITDHDFLSHIGLTPDDRTRQGLLATAFMVGYGVSSFVLTPFCAALFGVRRSLFAGLLLWGVVTFLSPAMNSYGLLLASRILLGVSEGPLFSWPAATSRRISRAARTANPTPWSIWAPDWAWRWAIPSSAT